ncbi:MAG: DUF1080 domain-containing protein [Bacteroidales bacterium]|jgi:hypothetical protein|nr:DUF1080 domain-containing protein [Bacteroidales bacterium]
MKKRILLSLVIFTLLFSCESKQEDFVNLFNGKDLTNWTLQKTGSFEVTDGEMVTRSSGSGTDIYTERVFGNFILQLEFLLSEVGNSGVFIRRDPSKPDTGFEVQILAPWTPRRDDLHCTGSLYGHVAVTNRPDETTGKWHKMEIVCDRHDIRVSINDHITTVAAIDTVKTLAGRPMIGYIGFQGNHAEKPDQFARFRNIRIRDLDAEPDYVLTGFSNPDWEIRHVSSQAAVRLGPVMIQPLAAMMSDNDPVLRNGAKQVLFDIVAKISDPARSEKEKRITIREIDKSIKAGSSEITSSYLRWLKGMLE